MGTAMTSPIASIRRIRRLQIVAEGVDIARTMPLQAADVI
jgi:hypothetical protein